MRKHTEQFKLSVIKEYLSGVGGIRALAQRPSIDESTVRKWVSTYLQHGALGIDTKYTQYDAQFRLLVLRHMWSKALSHQETAAVLIFAAQPELVFGSDSIRLARIKLKLNGLSPVQFRTQSTQDQLFNRSTLWG